MFGVIECYIGILEHMLYNISRYNTFPILQA